MADLGYTSVGGTHAGIVSASLEPVTAPENGTLDSISLYIYSDGEAGDRDIRAALYVGGTSDSDPTGATLLEDLGVIGCDGTGSVWKTVNSSTSPTFTTGQRLWVGIKSGAVVHGGINLSYDVGSGGDWLGNCAIVTSAITSPAETIAWDATIGSGYTNGTRHYSLYLTYSTGDTTPPTLSSPSASATGGTTGSGSVSTDEGNGTLYFVVTTSATAPTAAQVKAGQDNAGAAAADSGSQSVSATGSQSISGGFTGLTSETTYYAHYMQEDAATNQSSVASSSSFTTADVTAPTLSSPTATDNADGTADGHVDTDEANGTLYWIISTSATAPSVAQIQAGNDSTGSAAADSGSQSVTATGTQDVTATGLADGTTYYFYFQQQDAATNDSTVASASGFTTGDTTAPTLTSPSASATGATAATGSVSTDEANGTLYWVCTESGTAPSVAQIQADQDNSGSAAADSGSQSVSATGVQNVSASGLTPSTTYYIHFQHDDAASNHSAVVSSASFTTSAVGSILAVLTGEGPLMGSGPLVGQGPLID